jgi:hypothetical protein
VGANAALGSLSHVVREKFAPEGGPILQPIFEKMAHMVTNASKSLLNITAEGVNGVAESAKSKYQTFDLGPPPIRDAGGVPRPTCVLLVSVLCGVVSGFECAEVGDWNGNSVSMTGMGLRFPLVELRNHSAGYPFLACMPYALSITITWQVVPV